MKNVFKHIRKHLFVPTVKSPTFSVLATMLLLASEPLFHFALKVITVMGLHEIVVLSLSIKCVELILAFYFSPRFRSRIQRKNTVL